jgi:hypothetical protein
MLWYKVKKAQMKLFIAKVYKKAQKLCFAVVVLVSMLVALYAFLCSKQFYGLFETKTVTVYVHETAPKAEAKDNVSELADAIWMHESTKGTNPIGLHVTCKSKGLSNEYGYNPPVCYKDYATVRNIVENWIKDHKAQGLTDAELLSHYSNGAYTK